MFGKEALFVIDSGSNLCYLDKEFFDSINYTGDIEKSETLTGATGASDTSGKVMTLIDIEGIQYELPLTVFDFGKQLGVFDQRPAGIIGANFLWVYKAIIDFNKGILQL